MAPSAVSVDVFDVLSEGQAAAVRQALDRTTSADGVAPLSEEARLRLVPGERGATHLVVTGPEGEAISAYGQLDRVAGAGAAAPEPGSGEPATAELFVVPESRRRRIGTALLQAVQGLAAELSVWAHGDLPGSARLAEQNGLVRVRDLLQLRRPLDVAIAAPTVPAGVTIRTFQPGEDEAAWLRLNATAFASHPEQGSWSAHDLSLRESEPWFDPEGFFLAERDGQLLGFHWTKVHTDEDPPLGEVYVLGVDPTAAGQGLGSALTAIGLRYLQGRGLDTVLLYVEADNAAALTVYERQGFARFAVDVSYRTA